jgi:uncharacterized FAD-dependent dehydrogenase
VDFVKLCETLKICESATAQELELAKAYVFEMEVGSQTVDKEVERINAQIENFVAAENVVKFLRVHKKHAAAEKVNAMLEKLKTVHLGVCSYASRP